MRLHRGTNCLQSVENNAHDEMSPGTPRCPGGKCATHFPGPPGMSSAFNRTLVANIGSTMALELRALFNVNAAAGLDCWGPVINLGRDPRWGRNGEAGPECPYLMGQYASSFTLGFQRLEHKHLPRNSYTPVPASPNPVTGVVTIKHWDGNTLEDSDGFSRHTFSDNVSNFVLADGYFPAFRAGVKAGASGVMCAYNSVQGLPACTSPLLKAQLKDWGFSGYVTSDSDAVADAWKPTHPPHNPPGSSKKHPNGGHGFYKTAGEASCAALTEGWCDINSGNTFKESLAGAVSAGLCTWADVDAALARTLKVRFELGLFDDRAKQPQTKLGLEAIDSPASQALAADAARQSMTLLERGELPFKPSKTMKLAVLGPLANTSTPLLGTHYKGAACSNLDNSTGNLDDTCVQTVYQALAARAGPGTVHYGGGCRDPICAPGKAGGETVGYKCILTGCPEKDIADAVAVAKESTHVVIVLGITGMESEGKGGDRTSIDLPAEQRALCTAVLALGKPTAIVMINGGAVSLAQEKAAGAGILEAYEPGKHGAGAIADVILGHQSPAGRLIYTIYDADWVKQTSMTQMDMTVAPGKTYRYYTGEPIWPFGHGFTFTTFNLTTGDLADADRTLPASKDATEHLTYTIDVRNTGAVDSDVVVTAYWSPVGAEMAVATPVRKQLFEYERVHVKAGSLRTVVFNVSALSFVLAAPNGDLVSAPGTYELSFDDGSGAAAAEATLKITGTEPVLVEAFPKMLGK